MAMPVLGNTKIMTKEQFEALEAIIARHGYAPYWEGSPYVAETGSGFFGDGKYSDSSVLEVPFARIELSEMKLVDIHDADSLVEEWIKAI